MLSQHQWLDNSALAPCAEEKAVEGKTTPEDTGENFLLVITAAVPAAALLQYKSHGKPRSSLCSLSTLPSWWLVTSRERSKVSSCSSSSSQSSQFLHAEQEQWEAGKGALQERCFEICGG